MGHAGARRHGARKPTTGKQQHSLTQDDSGKRVAHSRRNSTASDGKQASVAGTIAGEDTDLEAENKHLKMELERLKVKGMGRKESCCCSVF